MSYGPDGRLAVGRRVGSPSRRPRRQLRVGGAGEVDSLTAT